jgi:hypothetical protein
MENPSLAFSLSPGLKEQLEAEAAIRGVKLTELIRITLVDFIDHQSRVRPPGREVELQH